MKYYFIKHRMTQKYRSNQTKKSIFYRLLDNGACERLSTQGEGWVESKSNKKRLETWLLHPTVFRIRELEEDDVFIEMI